MTITNSSTKLVAIATGVAVAIALMGAVAVAPAQAAAALTSAQIQSILSLLQSFGADAATINNVNAALNGQATSGTGSNPNTGTCPALSRSLQQGASGADVKALQVFLNGNAQTQVSVSGAGSPGLETTFFGPATAAAVVKFQTLNNVSAIGIVGPATRAAIAAVCGNTTPGNTGGTGTTGGMVTVSAAAQPINSLAPQGASRVPFTAFTITNNSSAAVTINSVTVQRVGLGVDANFSGIVLLDSNGLQIGTAKTLNSNHQANIGDTGFTIAAGSSMTFMVAGNIATGLSTNGQVVALQVVAINTGATVSGSLPISGASQTINNTLTLGSVSTSTSSFDPGAAQTRNIGDTAVRFSGIKFTAGSTEDLKLYSIRWRQVGSASSADITNVLTVANGTNYPTTLDSSGKYYTTIFPGGLLITKGNSLDVYVQGDIAGSNAANRTIDFDIDKVTDVYFVGQLYGYGVAPSGTYTPWYNGYVATVNGGTVTTISKANTGKAASQNVAINVQNQPMGGFTTNFSGEAVSISGMTATIATTTPTLTGTGLFTNVSIVDENGTVVAGPVDATYAASGQLLTFGDTITFPTGSHNYYFQGKLASTITGGSFNVSTTPSTWTNPTGQTTGNTVSLSGVGTITMNSMTVKGAAVRISMSTTPASQSVVAGASQFTFANLLLDASQSGEDVRLASIPVDENGWPQNLTGCQMFDGSTALNTSSRVVNTIAPAIGKTTFSFDNVLRVLKGTIKTLAIKCNLAANASSSSTYVFTTWDTAGDYSITGDVSGVNVTPTGLGNSSGGTMTVNSASLALTVDSSSPASTTVSGGSTGQTVGVYNVRASNDTVTLTKIGLVLTSGTATNVTNVSLYNGSTLLGTATFGSGQSVATSTLSTTLTLNADTDYKITVKADMADVGVNKPGVEGAVVAIDPSSSEGNGTSGLVSSAGSGSTNGVRLYNSFPTFTTTGTGAVLNNGTQTLAQVTVAADSMGDIGLNKLTFSISTTTVSVTTPTFQGPNGNVASTTLSFNAAGTLLTVYFDSTSNTADATVGAGTSKTYNLGGTVSGLTTNGGVVSIALKADTAAVAVAATSTMSSSKIIWSPLSTTTINNGNDWTNGYALTKGCFAAVGLANDCNAVSVAK
ncbi:MAG: peptidoglycan-binding domain-containing protein [Patescibacteria group bacterium]